MRRKRTTTTHTVGMYSPGKALVVQLMSRQVLPTALRGGRRKATNVQLSRTLNDSDRHDTIHLLDLQTQRSWKKKVSLKKNTFFLICQANPNGEQLYFQCIVRNCQTSGTQHSTCLTVNNNRHSERFCHGKMITRNTFQDFVFNLIDF